MRQRYEADKFLEAMAADVGADDEEDVQVIRENGPAPLEVPKLEQEAPEQTGDGSTPSSEQAPESTAQGHEPVATPVPAKGDEEEHKPWLDEYNDLRNKVDLMQGRISRASQGEQPAPQKPLREVTDSEEYAQRMEAAERNAQLTYQAIKSSELRQANSALSALKEQYPDIEKFIPREQIERGIELRITNGTVGEDWKEPLIKVYDLASGGQRYQSIADENAQLKAELQRQKDELSAKRSERADRDLKAAGQVPAGGSAYQPPVMPTTPTGTGKPGVYKTAARAMTEALARLGG